MTAEVPGPLQLLVREAEDTVMMAPLESRRPPLAEEVGAAVVVALETSLRSCRGRSRHHCRA